MIRGAIILCGGKSSRMGRDKALLPFGAETLLERVVRIVADVVPAEYIVCVAAEGQTLPPLPAGVRVVFDEWPDCGPLAGLAAGLRAFGGEVEAAFVCGCDVPLLVPEFVERMFELCGEHQLAVVDDGERLHPLCGVYRTDVLAAADELLAADERSLVALIDACDAIRIVPKQLRDVDPAPQSLAACNTPQEYTAIVARPDGEA